MMVVIFSVGIFGGTMIVPSVVEAAPVKTDLMGILQCTQSHNCGTNTNGTNGKNGE